MAYVMSRLTGRNLRTLLILMGITVAVLLLMAECEPIRPLPGDWE